MVNLPHVVEMLLKTICPRSLATILAFSRHVLQLCDEGIAAHRIGQHTHTRTPQPVAPQARGQIWKQVSWSGEIIFYECEIILG